MNRPALNILLVEDSPSDAFLIRQALSQTERTVHVHTVTDGVEAMAFLHREPRYADAPHPDLILLDLNMPRKDGREVLADIKINRDLKCIPVIVLTSSAADQDMSTAYSLHANCYIVKPADFKRFKEVIKSVEDFWFNTVALLSPDAVAPIAPGTSKD